jgi:hypothetical protein
MYRHSDIHIFAHNFSVFFMKKQIKFNIFLPSRLTYEKEINLKLKWIFDRILL